MTWAHSGYLCATLGGYFFSGSCSSPSGGGFGARIMTESEKLPERRRTPIEQHIQTILVTVSTAAILFLANFSYDTSRVLAAMQADVRTLPAIYALKQELAIEADKRRDLEVEMARLRERVDRGMK